MNSPLHLVLESGRPVWVVLFPAALSFLPPPQRLSNPALSPCGQHMREAAERRQQLELEHEQALAVLNAKQQEIDLLQKVGGLSAQVRTHSHVPSGAVSKPTTPLWNNGRPDITEMTSEAGKSSKYWISVIVRPCWLCWCVYYLPVSCLLLACFLPPRRYRRVQLNFWVRLKKLPELEG